MGLKFYGATAAQNKDNAGETLLIDGTDISRLRLVKDEHPEEENFFHSIGALTVAVKIHNEKECTNERQLRVWRSVQAPLIYVEGELADDEDHPNAKSAAALVRFAQRPEIPLDIGLSIDGGIVEKRNEAGQPDEEGSILARTVALAASLTVKPCNPRCKLFLMNDLTKSDLAMSPPPAYWEALKKSQAKRSFNEISSAEFQLYVKMTKLKKSLADYMGGFTSIRCKKCGDGVRFFKSSKDLPNGCGNCKSHFSMSEIWQALNK
jgi:predicted Zn-ribbon and HTH transcriptional regulator